VGKRKHSKIRILLLPALAFVFLVGWCMYRVGNHKRTGTVHKEVKADGVTFLPAVYESPQELVKA
jgi:hypothetical protein